MNDREKRFWTTEMHKQTLSDYYKDREVTRVRYPEIEIDGCCHDATAHFSVCLNTEAAVPAEDEGSGPRSVYLRYEEDEISELVSDALAFEREETK